MDELLKTQSLISQGRFKAADAELNSLPSFKTRTLQAETLRLELLERLGRYSEAENLARRLLSSKSLSADQKGVSQFCLGLLLWEKGQPEAATDHFLASIDASRDAGDARRTAWTQLRLLVSVSGHSPSPASGRLLQEARQSILRLGDPVVSAGLHIFLGEIEAKRGLLAMARRHTALGQSLLKSGDNIWLDALSENTLTALAILQFDVISGMKHARRAIDLAQESGAAAILRAAYANLGNLHYLKGDYRAAEELLQQSYKLLSPSGEHANGSLDSLARTHLAQGAWEEANSLLERIEANISTPTGRLLYSSRYALLTRVELLMKQQQWVEALTRAEELLTIARQLGDRSLEALTYARCAEAAAVMSGAKASIGFLNMLATLLRGDNSPSHIAHYEMAIGASLLATAAGPTVDGHNLSRAASIYSTLGCAAELVSPSKPVPAALTLGPISNAQQFQSFASLLMHASRPEVTATSLVSVLQHANCVVSARAVARDADDREELLAAWGAVTAPADVRTFIVGVARGRTIELQLQPLPDIESHAAVNSAGFVIAAGQELERARLEREERLTLWPIDELPAEDDDSVVTGKMREVMLYARKVAPTNVTVLITGESGTGKEVLARAVHRYSQRSKKPFVPFNCTAVPRELLESHLFGFKRGAFTGADRDNPGLIRAAKDGTLFLDEVGELGLDLQPKLLRFLESGEINPLGETVPFSVNVRIVAATNANLKKLVQEGRFREDLYYRLNVIPLELPPLRERREEIPPLAQHFALKWSHELGKGRIRVADDLMEHLVVYPWPGNIRQLSNELNRMVATAETDATLTLDHLPKAMREETEQLRRRERGLELNVPLTDSLDHAVATLEREMIKLALSQNDGKVEAAAKALGISRKGLYLKRQRLGL